MDTQTVYYVGGVLITLLTIGGLFWKASWWLRDQFAAVSDKVQNWMDTHEEKDQKRHEDNLERFTKIETKLDVAIQNGHN